MHSSLQSLIGYVKRHPGFLLAAIFSIVQLILYLRLGIGTGGEADKYITQGQFLYRDGQMSESKFIFYLPVILLVWMCKALGSSYLPAILIQVAVSAFAHCCFYRMGNRLGGGRVLLSVAHSC